MKKRMSLIVWVCLLCCVFALCSCADNGGDYPSSSFDNINVIRGDKFSTVNERGFVSVSDEPASSFSLSTSRSAYTYMRKVIGMKRLPDKNSVRIEEYINYFDYDVRVPADADFGVYSNVFECPWNKDNKLLRITYKAREETRASLNNNLVFLVDVSASMYGDDRLGYAQTALTCVAESLGENDTVSLVTYAGFNKVVFKGKGKRDRDDILDGIASLTASGNTAGFDAISRAYEIAAEYYNEEGNNRVILITDGDFNIGADSADDLKELAAEKRDSGIFLTCVGVGYGNYRDDLLEALADSGNGEAYYLDIESEARRVFGEELTGTVFTVARDAKVQVVFDGRQVLSYRLIGYDNRALTGIQFDEEDTDAGEIGSGKQVTALYEIVPSENFEGDNTVANVKLRYRNVKNENKETTTDVLAIADNDDDAFIACVAEYGLLLRRSAYAPYADFNSLTERLDKLTLTDEYKKEFKKLANNAAQIYQLIYE